MASKPINAADNRTEARDKVFCRTRFVLADRRSLPAIVVNISPHGLMLRVEADVAPGEWIRITVPVIGEVDAVVRWSLGGRLGCQLGRSVEPPAYTELLAAIGV